MRQLATYLLCLLIVFLPGCQAFSQQQRDSGVVALQDAYERGEITAAQRDKAIEALDSGSASGLSEWLYLGGSVLASVLLGVPISVGAVQKKRGPVATPAERVARASAKAP